MLNDRVGSMGINWLNLGVFGFKSIAIMAGLGASGVLRGFFCIKSGNNPSGYLYSVGGVPSSVSQAVTFNTAYVWEGTNNYTFQFRVPVNDANLTQGNWLTIASQGGITVGPCAGVFTFQIGAVQYLVQPTHGFGYFDSVNNYLYFQITSPKNGLGALA